jgi:hypothetical protein
MDVWYAAYGSNLSRARFDIYLNGGRPSGGSHTYPGCRDATPPRGEAAIEIAAELAFGGLSQTWGGGVAFVDPGEGITLARLYLLTLEQFSDVVAQENWLAPGEIAFDELPEGLVVLDGDHTYRCIIRLADHDGRPVMTISQPAGTLESAPAAAYLRHIAEGLRECHSMTTEDVVAYLASKRGVAGVLSIEEVAAALS